MRAALDRRVIPEAVIDLVRTVQASEPAHLAGGVALSGAHLAHRLSGDIDLFLHEPAAHRRACRRVSDAVEAAGGTLVVVQDAGHLWRARVTVDELRAYRDELRERFRQLAVPG